MVRVVIVDDHAVVRSGLRQFFVATDDFEVAAEAATGGELIALVGSVEADVVLLEIVRGGDGEVYRPVENPILLDEVFAEFLALLDEQEDEDQTS